MESPMSFSTKSISGVAMMAALVVFLPLFAMAEKPEMPSFIVIDGDTLVLAAPLEVIGSMVPAALPGVVRTMDMLSADDLARLPGRSMAEQLQTVPGVVVSQRQQYGVQADLSIRGSSFEQVQVLMDCYDMTDPQTGHHLMNLPVGQHDIKRLEVLPGHGSAIYGSGAFGGTVNVVTRRPGERTGGRAAITGGGQGIWGFEASGDLVAGDNSSGRISIEHFQTDGYDVLQDDGTQAWGGNDADTWTGNARLIHKLEDGEIDIQGGYADRQFGALGYYAPYPSWEETKTAFVAGKVTHRVADGITLEPRVFYRRHTDQFVLFRDNPDAYTNNHLTHKVGTGVRGIMDLPGRNTLALGVEGVYEDIDSEGIRGGNSGDALGFHLRRRASVAAELNNNDGPAIWQLGGRLDTREGYKPRLSTTAAMSVLLNEQWTVRGSIGTVHRIPTFTELYYTSPSDLGDPGLEAETGWSWDTGLEWYDGPWFGHISWFQRYEDNLIEWARPLDSGQPWQAMNIAEGRVKGAESRLAWRHGAGHLLSVGYTWLEKETTLPTNYEGKYSLLTPKHLVQLQASAVLPWNLGWTLGGRYLERTAGPDDFRYLFVLDSRLDWVHRSGFFASLVGTNLLDRRYEEIPGVEMSGLLITATVGMNF